MSRCMVKGCERSVAAAVTPAPQRPLEGSANIGLFDYSPVEVRVCLTCAREITEGKHKDISMEAKVDE